MGQAGGVSKVVCAFDFSPPLRPRSDRHHQFNEHPCSAMSTHARHFIDARLTTVDLRNDHAFYDQTVDGIPMPPVELLSFRCQCAVAGDWRPGAMIPLPPSTRIFQVCGTTDMRKASRNRPTERTHTLIRQPRPPLRLGGLRRPWPPRIARREIPCRSLS